jgi:hypothetical protein
MAALLWKARELDSLIATATSPIMVVDKFPHTVMDMVAQIVMESIHYEKQALHELNFACVDLFHEQLGTGSESSYTRLAGLINAFGESVLHKLRAMRAYQNGYLYYQFHDWLGRDMVLRHLHTDHIPNL